jgi:hypothetical protein
MNIYLVLYAIPAILFWLSGFYTNTAYEMWKKRKSGIVKDKV